MKGTQVASDIKYYLDYSKWNEGKGRRENWKESVERVMNMHKVKLGDKLNNPTLQHYFDFAQKAYEDKLILGSQRALQFGFDNPNWGILKHNAKMYNCIGGYADKPEFFSEAMYWLMCGCGVGFSVQKRHTSKLPPITPRTKGTKTYVVEDSVEGWADAFGVLVNSYFERNKAQSKFKEYSGYIIHFDLSLIRPEGALIAGGFKAPGPEGLRKSLFKTEQLLDKQFNYQTSFIEEKYFTSLKSIVIYDVVMHMSDAVLSGGVRRSATICLFDKDDEEMLNAKTGNWLVENPQRARSNNSVVLVRKDTTYEEFLQIFERIKQFGEPGFYFVDDPDQITNPCVEIGFYPKLENGETGWQGCNLTEGNGGKCIDKPTFLRMCKASAILGTFQASYTDFIYLGKNTKKIFDREALLGCSITGWTTNSHVLFNEELLKEGAELIKQINKEVAELIGINPASRTTCVKPSGNSSVLLETSSGIHAEHDKRYFRIMQINKEDDIAKTLAEKFPLLIENSIWSANNTDYCIYIPIEAKPNSLFKNDLLGVEQLNKVKLVQQNWVEYGTNVDLCVKPFLRHNVSNTVTVKPDQWNEVAKFTYDNKEYFTGISYLLNTGDKIYNQAPFTSVYNPSEILEEYGDASIFASGLIVDALEYFDNNLYEACEALNKDYKLVGTKKEIVLKKDWIRRAKQFAKRYFKGDFTKMTDCLKEVNYWHKWIEVTREMGRINTQEEFQHLKPNYVAVDTLGSIACIGGACEVPFMN